MQKPYHVPKSQHVQGPQLTLVVAFYECYECTTSFRPDCFYSGGWGFRTLETAITPKPTANSKPKVIPTPTPNPTPNPNPNRGQLE